MLVSYLSISDICLVPVGGEIPKVKRTAKKSSLAMFQVKSEAPQHGEGERGKESAVRGSLLYLCTLCERTPVLKKSTHEP